MICPKCGYVSSARISKDAIRLAKKYRKDRYSLRDIEALLRKKGFYVSIATLSREFKKKV